MNRFLTIADVAEYLNVSAGQVRTLIRTGKIPAIQVGGRGQWRMREEDVEHYVEECFAATRERVNQGW